MPSCCVTERSQPTKMMNHQATQEVVVVVVVRVLVHSFLPMHQPRSHSRLCRHPSHQVHHHQRSPQDNNLLAHQQQRLLRLYPVFWSAMSVVGRGAGPKTEEGEEEAPPLSMPSFPTTLPCLLVPGWWSSLVSAWSRTWSLLPPPASPSSSQSSSSSAETAPSSWTDQHHQEKEANRSVKLESVTTRQVHVRCLKQKRRRLQLQPPKAMAWWQWGRWEEEEEEEALQQQWEVTLQEAGHPPSLPAVVVVMAPMERQQEVVVEEEAV